MIVSPCKRTVAIMDSAVHTAHHVLPLLAAAALLLLQLACAAPEVQEDGWTLSFDTTTTLNVLYNDGQDRGQGLKITAVSTPALSAAGSKAVIVGCWSDDEASKWNQQGCINYTAPGFAGNNFVQDSFTYTVQSNASVDNTASAPVTIDVTFAPVANDDTYEVDNLSGTYTFAVLDNDSDPNGRNITLDDDFRLPAGVSRVNEGRELRVVLKGAALTFTYQIRNDWWLTDTATVTIKKQALPIILQDDDQSVSVKRIAVFQVLENDENGGKGLTIVSVTQPNKGTVSIANCSEAPEDFSRCIQYNAPDVPALVYFNYTATNAQGATGTARVTLQVALPPSAKSDNYKMYTRKPTWFNVTSNDKRDKFHNLPFEIKSISSVSPSAFKVTVKELGVMVTPPLTGTSRTTVTFNYTITNWASDTSDSTATVKINFQAASATCAKIGPPGAQCTGKPTRSCSASNSYCAPKNDGYYCQYAKRCGR